MIVWLEWYYLIGMALYAALLCSEDFAKGLLQGTPAETKPWQIILSFFILIFIMAPFWPVLVYRLLKGAKK